MKYDVAVVVLLVLLLLVGVAVSVGGVKAACLLPDMTCSRSRKSFCVLPHL